ncbi:MAG: hypothetical protein ABI378_05040 [Chitinophagaceae bacterium]
MAKQNLISTTIPSAAIILMEASLHTAIDAIAPHAVSLTDKQRKDLFKMGDKSTDIAAKMKGYLGSNPEFTPNYVNKADFDMDYAIPEALRTAMALSQQLNDLIDDTIMAAGSDIMDVGMSYYHSVRSAAHDGAPGAKAIYEDLKVRFANKSARQSTAAAKNEPK